MEEKKKIQEKAWNALDRLIGLEGIKSVLKGLIEHSARASGKNRVPGHYAFVGNPGTGKTEVARLMAKILYTNGLLRKSHFVEVKASDIIAQYVGQSAHLALEKCAEALDGVLFIDEAYSMVNTGDNLGDVFASTFARESYEAIMKFMEDHRQRITVIFAGYQREMNRFLDANPGMRSRVKPSNVVEFKDFSDDDLIKILELTVQDRNIYHDVLTKEFKAAIRKSLPIMRKEKGFANARSIRSLIEECESNAVSRIPSEDRAVLADGVEQLIFIPEDIPERYRSFREETTTSEVELQVKKESGCNSLSPFYLTKEKLITLSNPYEELDVEQFMTHCKRATMRVLSEGSYGTAFVITPDGYGITCAHIVMGQEFDKLTLRGRGEFVDYDEPNRAPEILDYEVISVRPDFDLALIKFNTDFELPYLKIAEEERVISDHARGRLYGFPGGKKGIKFPEWTIASAEEDREDGGQGSIQSLQVQAFPGDSGGPVVSEDGLVIGVLQGAQNYGEGQLIVMKPVKHFWREFTE